MTTDWFKDQVVELIPPLRGYAMTLAGSGPEADDLVQEALMRAWRSRKGFQAGTKMKAWLSKILRNAFYTHAGKRRNTVQDVDGRMAAQLASSPEQELRLRYAELLAALQRLTPEALEALLLVAGSGLSHEDGAEVCGCAVGTRKSRVSRAGGRLAELIDVDFRAG